VGTTLALIEDAKKDGRRKRREERWNANSPNSPHVDTRTVLLQPKEQLWRSIPPRYDHVRVLGSSNGSGTSSKSLSVERSSETKIGDLEDSLVVDEEVGRLHVSMEDVVLEERERGDRKSQTWR